MSENNISQQISNNVSELGKNISDGTKSVGEGFSNVRDSVNSSVQDFSENVSEYSSSDYLKSNGIIAKFAFLILVLIAFLIFMKLGSVLISYMLQPSSSPYLIPNMIGGSDSKTISQDPTKADSVQILRSNNQMTGMEFTWSTWLFIDKIETDRYYHIFTKGGNGGGNEQFDSNGIMKVNNGPGVYIKGSKDANTNTTCMLHIVMNTATATPTSDISTISDTVDVNNIPMGSWVNVIIRLQNKIMDVYINGVIAKRTAFTNVPLQNYDDVYVCCNGGFSGKLSSLRYFNHALNVFEINNVVSSGPNLTFNTGGNYVQNYLSSMWYTSA